MIQSLGNVFCVLGIYGLIAYYTKTPPLKPVTAILFFVVGVLLQLAMRIQVNP
jgi:hypothetical protein